MIIVVNNDDVDRRKTGDESEQINPVGVHGDRVTVQARQASVSFSSKKNSIAIRFKNALKNYIFMDNRTPVVAVQR